MDAHRVHDQQGTRDLSAYAPRPLNGADRAAGRGCERGRGCSGRSAIAWLLHDARPLLPARAHALVPLLVAAAWVALMQAVPDRLDEMSDIGLVSVLPDHGPRAHGAADSELLPVAGQATGRLGGAAAARAGADRRALRGDDARGVAPAHGDRVPARGRHGLPPSSPRRGHRTSTPTSTGPGSSPSVRC